MLVVFAISCFAQPYFVSPAGNDANPGTLEKPFATLQRAQQAVRQKHGDVFLRGGTYYLPATLVFTARRFRHERRAGGFPKLSRREAGHQRRRQARKSGLAALHERNFSGEVPADLQTEEIFVNGERQILARYPNFDPKAQYFDGFTSDADINAARRAMGGSGRRLFARDAPGAVGRFHLAHHRKGYERQI